MGPLAKPPAASEEPFIDWFPLAGDIFALAIWMPEATEGAIYADVEWQRLADEQTRHVAEWRAEDVVGAESITWRWHLVSAIKELTIAVPPLDAA